MSKNNTQTSTKINALTTTNITYARICVILLALNFVVTGYVLSEVVELQAILPQNNAGTNSGLRAKPTTPNSSAVEDSTESVRTLFEKKD